MTATTEPRGGLDLGWDPGEDGWGPAMNANLLRLSRFGFHASVLSMTTAAPPGSPTNGAGYIIPSGASGEWAGKAGQVAVWGGSAWAYAVPRDGWTIHVVDAGLATYEDGAWSQSNAIKPAAIGAEPYAGAPAQTSFWRSTAAGVRAWVQLIAADITDLATTLAGYLPAANPEFTGALSQSGVERITSGGEAHIIGARISGLSQNVLPRVADANKQLGDSAFADDGTQATISRSLMVLSGPNPMFKLDSQDGNDFYIQSTATALKILSQANSSGHIEFFPAQSLILRLTTQGVSQFPVNYDFSDGDLFGVVELQPRKDSYTNGAIAATGRIWNSGERQALSIFDGAAASPYRGRIRADRWFAYSTLIIQNKTVHTSWFAGGTGDGSATIPANYLKKGRRVHIHGRVLCSSCAASSAPEITLTIGAHTIWTQAKTLAVAAGHDVVVEFWVDAYLDSYGVLNALGRIEFSSWGIDSPHIYKFGTAITSFDPTTAKLVDCTLKPSSASEIWVRSIARVEA